MTKPNQQSRLAGPAIVGGFVAVATLAASAPASVLAPLLASSAGNISFARIEGTIWRGEIGRLTVNGTKVGDVSYRIDPLSLAALSPRLALQSRGGAITGKATVTLRPDGVRVDDLVADIQVAGVAPRGLLGEPAIGVARINAQILSFSRTKGCRAANGDVWTDVLDAPARRYGLAALPLSGPVACDGEDLTLKLSGMNSDAEVDVSLRLDARFSYEFSANVGLAQRDMAPAFRLFGFEDEGDRLIYGSTGVLRSAGS